MASETAEMSQPLADATGIDWKLVGSAVGVFIATIVTTVWGWIQGRKKSEKASEYVSPTPDFHIAGAVLQDNMSLRENTQAARDLRDQMVLLIHVLERHVRVQDGIEEHLEELVKRLDKAV